MFRITTKAAVAFAAASAAQAFIPPRIVGRVAFLGYSRTTEAGERFGGAGVPGTSSLLASSNEVTERKRDAEGGMDDAELAENDGADLPPSALSPSALVNENAALIPRLQRPSLSDPASDRRLFSNVRYSSDGLAEPAGSSLLSSTLLVAGTTIGAGILALPSLSLPAGFIPSSIALGSSWTAMCISGLLLSELQINLVGLTGRTSLSIIDQASITLGLPGKAVATIAYVFLHYALLTAYVAQGGDNLYDFLGGGLPTGVGQIAFAAACVAPIYTLSNEAMGKLNNGLVAAALAAFGGLLAVGLPTVANEPLLEPLNQHPEAIIPALPVMLLSLVYHNVIPTIVQDLEADPGEVRKAIVFGSAIPLLMFEAYNYVVLGNAASLMGINSQGLDPVQILQQSSQSPVLGGLVAGFSELAIITSLVGFVYGLRDAIGDLFSLPAPGSKEYSAVKPFVFAAISIPPVFIALEFRDIFLRALELGGLYGVVGLFLVLPPLMVGSVRYGDKTLTCLPLVPGGKVPLGGLWKTAATVVLGEGVHGILPERIDWGELGERATSFIGNVIDNGNVS